MDFLEFEEVDYAEILKDKEEVSPGFSEDVKTYNHIIEKKFSPWEEPSYEKEPFRKEPKKESPQWESSNIKEPSEKEVQKEPVSLKSPREESFYSSSSDLESFYKPITVSSSFDSPAISPPSAVSLDSPTVSVDKKKKTEFSEKPVDVPQISPPPEKEKKIHESFLKAEPSAESLAEPSINRLKGEPAERQDMDEGTPPKKREPSGLKSFLKSILPIPQIFRSEEPVFDSSPYNRQGTEAGYKMEPSKESMTNIPQSASSVKAPPTDAPPTASSMKPPDALKTASSSQAPPMDTPQTSPSIKTPRLSEAEADTLGLSSGVREALDTPKLSLPSPVVLSSPPKSKKKEEKKDETPSKTKEDKISRLKLKTPQNYLELEKTKVSSSKENWVLCQNCGALNNPSNEFCQFCQMEIIKVRKMELDYKPTKVKLKLPKDDTYVFCTICGAPNPKENDYCKDCAQPLPRY